MSPPQARLCKRFLPISSKAVLRDIAYHFARRMILLTPAVTTFYVPEFSNVFRIPGTAVRVLQCYIPESVTGLQPAQVDVQGPPRYPRWKRFGEYVGVPGPSVDLLYTDDVAVGEFDSLAVEVLSAHLAMKLCIPLTQSNTVKKEISGWYLNQRKEAANTNGLEGIRDKFKSPGRLTQVRRARAGTVAG